MEWYRKVNPVTGVAGSPSEEDSNREISLSARHVSHRYNQ